MSTPVIPPGFVGFFDRTNPRLNLLEALTMMKVAAQGIAVSEDNPAGLLSYCRTSARCRHDGTPLPLVPDFPEPAGRLATATELAALKRNQEAVELVVKGLPLLIAYSLQLCGSLVTASLVDPVHGLLHVNMQTILDVLERDFSQLQLSDIATLEARSSTWDPLLNLQQNFSVWERAYAMLAANDAGTGNHKKLINVQQAIRHMPHYVQLVQTWLLQNINIAGQTYLSLKEFLIRADLIIPAPITPTAQSFLNAAVGDDWTAAAAATIDARLKALEDKGGTKAHDKQKKKKPAAAPAAPGAPAATVEDKKPCNMCRIWHRHDPVNHPNQFLWGKCTDHNPDGVK